MCVQKTNELLGFKSEEKPYTREIEAKKSIDSKLVNYSGVYNNYNINITIDSLHITSYLNPYDLPKLYTRYISEFDIEQSYILKFYVKEVEENIHVKNFKIFINKYNFIDVSYHNYTRTYKYEFSGLSQYKKIDKSIVFIIKYIYNNYISISRIDIAIDIFSNKSLFDVNPKLNNFTIKTVKSTNYYNSFYSKKKKKFTFTIYPKNSIDNDNDIYQRFSYCDITRMELRFENNFLANNKLKDLFSNNESILKIKKIVIETLCQLNITYNNQNSNFEHLKIDAVLYDFINFLKSDSMKVKYSNYLKFSKEINKQTYILNKIKKIYNIKSIQELINLKMKSGKINISRISQKTGIHRKTITKIFEGYK